MLLLWILWDVKLFFNEKIIIQICRVYLLLFALLFSSWKQQFQALAPQTMEWNENWHVYVSFLSGPVWSRTVKFCFIWLFYLWNTRDVYCLSSWSWVLTNWESTGGWGAEKLTSECTLINEITCLTALLSTSVVSFSCALQHFQILLLSPSWYLLFTYLF